MAVSHVIAQLVRSGIRAEVIITVKLLECSENNGSDDDNDGDEGRMLHHSTGEEKNKRESPILSAF